ncbi:MAG: 1-acyl-sn-glycerol-3-phosphate acyltransferase [Clostridia bacterium]|nr:1-acyl-sn-glycerol-3-phosphate acyltransferase [Clostridia bacterium]
MLLNWIFTALAVSGSALICGLTPLSPWWGLPLAVGLYAGAGIVFIILVLLSTLLLPKDTPSKKRYGVYHWFIQHTLSWVMLVLGYRISLQGAERIPTDRPFLLVSNHLSNMDPLITLAVFRKWHLGYVSKPENFKIPVIGIAMRRACFLSIDRENPRNAVTTIKRAAEQITDMGLSMAIYPEGTRNKSGEGLLPFHAGSFKIAKLAKCPVAVMTVRYDKRRPFGKIVTLNIVDMMDEAYVAEHQTADMSDRARTAMEKNLNK